MAGISCQPNVLENCHCLLVCCYFPDCDLLVNVVWCGFLDGRIALCLVLYDSSELCHSLLLLFLLFNSRNFTILRFSSEVKLKLITIMAYESWALKIDSYRLAISVFIYLINVPIEGDYYVTFYFLRDVKFNILRRSLIAL